MYIEDSFMCLSFHTKKHLKIGKGGMILTNSKEAVEWFKMARYEGRDHVHDGTGVSCFKTETGRWGDQVQGLQ